MMKKKGRQNSEKKIIFLTDMDDNEDNKFFECLKQITNDNISVDLIGIGYDLNILYADKISDIKNISVHTIFKQEHVNKILVDDFEYNFFPIAKDLKIEFSSNNLKILKCYGTGYENPKKSEIDNEESENLKIQLEESKTFLFYFNSLRKYYKKRFNRISLYALENIGKFLRFNKKEIAEIDKLLPSNIKYENNTKFIKGNMVLLKLKIDNMDLHKSFNRKEMAEIVFKFVDFEDDVSKKIYFPVIIDFERLENLKKIKEENLMNKRNYFEMELNSTAINNAVCIYYTAKFLRKLMKQYHERDKKILNSVEGSKENHIKYTSKENIENVFNEIHNDMDKRNLDGLLKEDLLMKIKNLKEKIYLNKII